MARTHRRTGWYPVAGDIVVTKVAAHYHVARAEAEGHPWSSIQLTTRLGDALTLACRLAIGSPRRVFIYARRDRYQYVEIDCAKPPWL